jgi:hypothetical protein
MGLAWRAQGGRRRRCGDIVDDEQRSDRRATPHEPFGFWAALGHLLPWRSSTMSPHRLRRAAHLPPRRTERGPS